jgi:hypothetical protein
VDTAVVVAMSNTDALHIFLMAFLELVLYLVTTFAMLDYAVVTAP